ncbi:odorant receptor 4-like isoform X1 [Harpegnathos saltator]|uniref:odorant receptor 4-like isoform X1 n=1 Tax=Harpegnathos saltator TaxID=610380 RepID=UPI000DBED651|nr:odorant receptor 4-like isoform X1 [Harpegnathos saltator]
MPDTISLPPKSSSAKQRNMEKSISVHSRRIISWPLKMLLCLFGIWPGLTYGLACKAFWLIVMVVGTILQYTFLVIHARTIDFTTFMYASAFTLALSTKFIKIAIFWYNQRRFNEMWRTMSTNWELGSDCTNAIDSAGKIHVLRHLPNFIVAFNSISVIMNSANILTNSIHHDEASNITQSYVVWMHLPFDVNKHSVYLVVIFLQFFYVLILSAGAATINSVLVILMLYLGGQVDVICRCLTHMPQGKHVRMTDVTVVKEIIRKHQSVITFSEHIESLYTYIALILLLLNTLITCGLGFILVTSVGSPIFAKMVMKNLMFYCVVNIETFVFCFAGEYISSKSREIGEAAYNSPWYQSKFHSRMILFMIMRSQHQLTITMGKFMDLSLERFSTITKASASYMSVLLAMY